ncbi:hypothetical protein Axy04_012 [Achromobacter phage vB_AxyP_19-32_Axy04]|uniref:Uncharacterized protein n=1 Tax=Achromobacter phage vB_AxyP_19-32_Axy04 TaxID=2591039 RepID=A0A514CTK7_9CAUD|nr:hypothetical protein KMC55_gp12 [Achromobacter phage vB_AxyP_19-32_Axy04]QDH83794.1 hypothetical protein Axy04_012 [Achromobacter phage vB_AxyP_19-32_Axy04]
MSLYAFLNMLMVIACGGAMGYILHWFLSYKLIYAVAKQEGPLPFLAMMCRRTVFMGLAVAVILAVIITPVG